MRTIFLSSTFFCVLIFIIIYAQVATLYGPVDFPIAADWPFVSSYDDLEAFAKWKGGRIPNEIELRAFMDQYLGAESSNIGFKHWTFISCV